MKQETEREKREERRREEEREKENRKREKEKRVKTTTPQKPIFVLSSGSSVAKGVFSKKSRLRRASGTSRFALGPPRRSTTLTSGCVSAGRG
jgi:hypothetical protein